MTLLSLFFPCYSSTSHTAGALLYNNRALHCLFFPLSQLHLCCNYLYHSRLQTTTTSAYSHAVALEPQPALLLSSSSSTVVAASPSRFPQLPSFNNIVATWKLHHRSLDDLAISL
ncbi:hypothetical protein GW17_00057248 [Ensete ventricosum]|nr:hypothetical protein GW17_00057248 [Ensete ventricosum]